MKIYIEVSGGTVSGVYTDDNKTEIEIVICDHDNAACEFGEDRDDEECEFIHNCTDIEEERANLRRIY